MTTAPSDLLALRKSIAQITGVTNPVEIGIVGDDAHGNGYHLGVQSIKDRGNYPTDDYSTRQSRDRVGGDFASAMDITLSWVHGGRKAAIQWSNAMVNALKNGQLPGVRAINYLNFAGQKRRYDSFSGTEVSTSDTVDIHTHIEWWRDSEGRRSFDKMLGLMQQAVGGISVAEWTQQQINDVVYTLVGNSGGPIHTRMSHLEATVAQILTAVSKPLDTNAIVTAVTNAVSSLNVQLSPDEVTAIGQAAADAVQNATVSALQSDAGQAALITAANEAEDS